MRSDYFKLSFLKLYWLNLNEIEGEWLYIKSKRCSIGKTKRMTPIIQALT